MADPQGIPVTAIPPPLQFTYYNEREEKVLQRKAKYNELCFFVKFGCFLWGRAGATRPPAFFVLCF